MLEPPVLVPERRPGHQLTDGLVVEDGIHVLNGIMEAVARSNQLVADELSGEAQPTEGDTELRRGRALDHGLDRNGK